MRILFALCFAALLSGCATVTTVSVSSLAAPELSAAPANKELRYYELLPSPSMPGVQPGDLQFLEFSRYVEKALAAKGYARLSAGDPLLPKSKVAVLLAYYIEPIQESRWEPGMAYVSPGPWRHRLWDAPPEPYYYLDYCLGITIQAQSAVYDEATRSLVLSPGRQLWRTDLTSIGDEGDLRVVFPRMIAAAHDLIGTSTPRAVTVDIRADDPRVGEIER
jgi:hypothetical protein